MSTANLPPAVSIDTPATLQKHFVEALCGSTLLHHPSLLKLASLRLVSGASLHLTFYAKLRQRPEPFLRSHLARLHVGCVLIRNKSRVNIILPSNVWRFKRIFARPRLSQPLVFDCFQYVNGREKEEKEERRRRGGEGGEEEEEKSEKAWKIFHVQ